VFGDEMMVQMYANAAAAVATTNLMRQSLFAMTAADATGEQPGVEEAQCSCLATRHLRAALDQPDQQLVRWV
jgi:hypothetical protein